MAEQKAEVNRRQSEVEDIEHVDAPPLKSEKLAADIDALLDSIDDVLEENAEQFVKQYVQKGGQ